MSNNQIEFGDLEKRIYIGGIIFLLTFLALKTELFLIETIIFKRKKNSEEHSFMNPMQYV